MYPRVFRDAHKTRTDELGKAQQTLTSCLTRFSPFGNDGEWRGHFVFLPSAMEKDAASDTTLGDPEEVGTEPKKSTRGSRGRRAAGFVSRGAGAMDESKREEF